MFLVPGGWATETVRLPMTVEYSLLRRLIVDQAYPEPGDRATVVNLNQGCNEIWLASPQVAEENGEVRLQTELHVSWGTPVAGNCFAPIEWSGTIVFWQQPTLGDDWRLRFSTRNSSLLNRAGEKTAIPGLIWDLAKQNVHGFINSIAINLAPPVDNVKRFMQPQTGQQASGTAEKFLASMRPDQPLVRKDGLAIHILADADVPPVSEMDSLGVPPIEDPAAQERILALWQTWDALLVNMIGQLASRELTVEDRQLLLDTLLTVRYEFAEVLGSPEFTTSFVRRQFISCWVTLKPLFERHNDPRSADSLLGYLSFFTAADALVVLDRLGPMLGIEVSREGFYRLAHLLSDEKLNEGGGVDPRLRELLGIGPPLPLPDPDEVFALPVAPAPGQVPAIPEQAEPVSPPLPGDEAPDPFAEPDPFEQGPNKVQEPGNAGAVLWRWWQELFTPVASCVAAQPTLESVSIWTAELTPADQLLSRVRILLAKAARNQEAQLDKTVGTRGWGQRLLEATAWQESCFRQFVIQNGKVNYLLSYNNTSVGVMQVNERVWRGIYDVKELRWNPEYNIMAGAEILALYLNRYIAKHKDFGSYGDEEGRRHIATWLYALYNSGPGQLNKFQQRNGKGRLRAIDRLFQEKYSQVDDEGWANEVQCLPSSSG